MCHEISQEIFLPRELFFFRANAYHWEYGSSISWEDMFYIIV